MIIDVSKHNGVIDWEKAKSKIEGAIIRVGYGSDIESQDDQQAKRNMDECERLGIPYGVYLYSYAKNATMAQSEAKHVYRMIKGRKLSLPVYFDAEENSLGGAAATCYLAFYKAIKEYGYRCGLYTGVYYYRSYMNNVKTWDSLWVARYGTNNGTRQDVYKPSFGVSYDLWQYTSKGKVSGISGNVDLSEVYNKTVFAGTTADKTTAAKKTNDQIAQEVIDGKWGNGDARKAALTKAGYDYSAIQKIVNSKLQKKDTATYYTVKKGDTLTVKLNNISNVNLRRGKN